MWPWAHRSIFLLFMFLSPAFSHSPDSLIEALSLPLHAYFLNMFDGIWSYLQHTAHPIAWLVFLSFFSIVGGSGLDSSCRDSLLELTFSALLQFLSLAFMLQPEKPFAPFRTIWWKSQNQNNRETEVACPNLPFIIQHHFHSRRPLISHPQSLNFYEANLHKMMCS